MTDQVSRVLHADWPALVGGQKSWDLPAPLDDLCSALQTPLIKSAGSGGISIDMVAHVERYSISHHGAEWKPGGSGGTELSMYVVGTLVDGRWFSVEAWNDYTGWGCRDDSEVYIGATEDDVVANGVTSDGRSALGYPAVSA